MITLKDLATQSTRTILERIKTEPASEPADEPTVKDLMRMYDKLYNRSDFKKYYECEPLEVNKDATSK